MNILTMGRLASLLRTVCNLVLMEAASRPVLLDQLAQEGCAKDVSPGNRPPKTATSVKAANDNTSTQITVPAARCVTLVPHPMPELLESSVCPATWKALQRQEQTGMRQLILRRVDFNPQFVSPGSNSSRARRTV
jgi:hypothetical protein